MRARFEGLALDAVIGAVPARVSRFDDEIPNYTHDPADSAKLKAVMGYGEHRIAPPGMTTADLARAGLQALIERGALRPDEVDALFFVSQTPDHPIPATSALLHGAFGLRTEAYCADINDGCNGYIKGLYEAAAFLSATGSACAVLVAGDVLSARVSPRDRNSYPLIGDAATVSVLRRQAGAAPLTIEIHHDGRGHDALIITAGGARQPIDADTGRPHTDADGNVRSAEQLRMNGRDVFAFTQTTVPAFLTAFAERQRSPLSDYQRIYAHQANAFILDRLRRKLKVDDTVLPDRVVRRWGNSSSGTVPMLIATETATDAPMHCLLAGFGVGLSWGAADLRLDPVVPRGLLELP